MIHYQWQIFSLYKHTLSINKMREEVDYSFPSLRQSILNSEHENQNGRMFGCNTFLSSVFIFLQNLSHTVHVVIQLIQFLFLSHSQVDCWYILYHHQYPIPFYDDYDLKKTKINKNTFLNINYLLSNTNQICVFVV